MRTLRKETKINGQVVEVRTNLSEKDYEVCKLLSIKFCFACISCNFSIMK